MTKQNDSYGYPIGDYLYKVNMLKAEQAPHAHYVFRLMAAINDLTCLLNYVGSGSLSPKHRGEQSFFLRIFQCQVFEAYKAFVSAQNETEITSPINYFCKKPEIMEKFANLKRLGSHSYMNKIAAMRNSIGFHYNYQGGKVYSKALKDISSNATNLQLHPYSYYALKPLRFVCADLVVETAWYECIGIKREEDVGPYFAFLEEAALALIDFGDIVFLWFKDHDIAEPHSS